METCLAAWVRTWVLVDRCSTPFNTVVLQYRPRLISSKRYKYTGFFKPLGLQNRRRGVSRNPYVLAGRGACSVV